MASSFDYLLLREDDRALLQVKWDIVERYSYLKRFDHLGEVKLGYFTDFIQIQAFYINHLYIQLSVSLVWLITVHKFLYLRKVRLFEVFYANAKLNGPMVRPMDVVEAFVRVFLDCEARIIFVKHSIRVWWSLIFLIYVLIYLARHFIRWKKIDFRFLVVWEVALRSRNCQLVFRRHHKYCFLFHIRIIEISECCL